MNNKKGFAALLFILFIMLAVWGGRQAQARNQPDFTIFSTNDDGVSLMYDTLRYMNYPVGALYRPLDIRVSVNDAVLIIQPEYQYIDRDMVQSIIYWVRRGGRLIYLDDDIFSAVYAELRQYPSAAYGDFWYYKIGAGEIVTGPAYAAANIFVMENSGYTATLAYILNQWHADRILFAEYYHGYTAGNSAFRQMPTAVRLAAYQLVIAAALALWHFGKRFGQPVPLYDEIERDENEQVFTLAKLYGLKKPAKDDGRTIFINR